MRPLRVFQPPMDLDLPLYVDHAPSGTGGQVSLPGLAGVTVARDERLELNLLGLGFGIDVDDRALQLPGFGRLP